MADSLRQDRGLVLVDDLVAEGRSSVTAVEVQERLGLSRSAASNLLRRLMDEGLLERVRPGHYVVRPLGVLGTSAAADDLADAVGAAFSGLAHRIAYRSALDELDLLVHPARTIQVAAESRVRLRPLSGRPIKVVVEPNDAISVGAVPRGRSFVSNRERALLDAARRPELVGGAPTLVEALAVAGPRADVDRLTEYARELRWSSALRRLGSLSDRLQIPGLAGLLAPISSPTADLDLEPGAAGGSMWRDRHWWVRWHRDPAELEAVLHQ
jgi:predicted transcriptional regulator of viral defense system